MAVAGTSHRTPPRGIIPDRIETGDCITMDRSNDTAGTIRHQAKKRQVYPLLDCAAEATTRPNDEARDDEMTGIPDNVAFQTYVIFRCNRWGTYERWFESAGIRESKPKAVRSWWGQVVLNANVAQDWFDPRDICPVDILEALETRACVRSLPPMLRDVIVQEHVMHGTQQQKAETLKISRTTFWRHCQRAYVLLLGRFNDAGAGLDISDEE